MFFGGTGRELRPRKQTPKATVGVKKSKENVLHDTDRYFSFVRWDGTNFSPNIEQILRLIGGKASEIQIGLDKSNPGNLYFKFYDVGTDAKEKSESFIENAAGFLSPTILGGNNWYPIIPTKRIENILVGGEGNIRREAFALGININNTSIPIRLHRSKTMADGSPLIIVRYYDKTVGGLVDRMGTLAISQTDPRKVQTQTLTDSQELDEFLNMNLNFGKSALIKAINNEISYLKSI